MRPHCSDSLLIAHADGELSLWRRWSVRKHLDHCWACRARVSELEVEAQELARTLRQDHFVPLDRWIAARSKLQIRLASYEDESDGAPQRLAFCVSACAVAVLIAIVLLPTRQTPVTKSPVATVDSAAVLESARAGEAALHSAPAPVHQVIDVEIDGGGAGPGLSGKLSIWSDPQSGREAARWESEGRVKYSVWRNGQEEARRYRIEPTLRARLAREVADSSRVLADVPAEDLDAATVEAAFLKWLEGRRWRPIALSSEFALFASRGGVTLSIERSAERSGPHLMRAVQERSGRKVEALVEMDIQTGKPRLTLIRIVTPHGHSEVRLRVVRAEVLGPGSVPAYNFGAERHQSPQRASIDRARDLVDALPTATPVAVEPHDVHAAEVAVWYELHRIKACLGEPLALERHPGGGLRLYGTVRSAERRDAISSAVVHAAAPVDVQVDLRTFDEEAAPTTAPPPAKSLLPPVRGRKLPIEKQLIDYFRSAVPLKSGATPASLATDFANQTIAASQDAMAHAWTLRRLFDRFPPGHAGALGSRPRYLLDSMTRDHLAALWTSMAEMKTLLEPVLQSISPDAFAGLSASTPRGGDVEHLFRSVQSVDVLLRRLLAGDAADPATKTQTEPLLELGREYQRMEGTYAAFEAARRR